MIFTNGRNRVVRLLLVLGLAVGPWPAAIASPTSLPPQAAATQQMEGDAPCPMDERAATPSCPCCDDGAPCGGTQCVLSTTATGLPVRVAPIALVPDGVNHHADLSTRPPEPRPGERLRPPIA